MVSVKEKLLLLACCVATYCMLLIGYYAYIVPIYGYMGFEWSPNATKIIEGALLTLAASTLLSVKFRKPSDLLLCLQLFFPVLPMFVLYGAADLSRPYVYWAYMAFALVVIIPRIVRLKNIKVINVPPLLLARVLVLASGAYILAIIGLGGLAYLNFDFTQVYELRETAASRLPGVFGYLSPMVSKVLLPFSLLLTMINRDYFFSVVAIAGSVLMFGLTNNKGPIFYPLVVLALYFLLHRKHVIRLVAVGILATIVASLVGFMYGGAGDWLGSLLMRRSYFVPAHLNFQYYDFFSANPHVLWAESRITLGIVDYRYDLDTSHLMGYEYFSDSATGANTGWIGSGYMHLGFAGMLVYACAIGLLFSLLNAYAKRIDKGVVVGVTVVPTLTLMMSSDLPTAFLTHGVILSIVLLTVFSLKEADAGQRMS